MAVSGMNHFTILTDNLDATLAFYKEHLDFSPGPRPPFTFPGAWLYAAGGKDPILHVIAGREKKDLVKGVLDHMAFTAQDLPACGGQRTCPGRELALRSKIRTDHCRRRTLRHPSKGPAEAQSAAKMTICLHPS